MLDRGRVVALGDLAEPRARGVVPAAHELRDLNGGDPEAVFLRLISATEGQW